MKVRGLREDFLAATFGEAGTPDTPTVFVAIENRFYSYRSELGIYVEEREAKLTARLSELLLTCARACAEACDTQGLAFKFRDTASLRGVLQRARGVLEVGPEYFAGDLRQYIACRNGMLRLALYVDYHSFFSPRRLHPIGRRPPLLRRGPPLRPPRAPSRPRPSPRRTALRAATGARLPVCVGGGPFVWSQRTRVRVGDNGTVPVGVQRHPVDVPPRTTVIRCLRPDGDIY